MSRWAIRILCCLLFAALLVAGERQDAVVVLAEPPVIEQMLAEQPDRPLRRERLLSAEGRERAQLLEWRKSPLLAAVRRRGVEIVGQTEVVLNAVMVRATAEELAALRNLPGVQSAEFADRCVLLLDAAVPLLQAPEAWNLPAIGGRNNAGRGIKIAVIDSGIDQTHPIFQDPDLVAPAGYPPSGGTSDPARATNKVIVARNFTTARDASDSLGHGTFVAAIAAGGTARSQSPAVTITGMAPKAYLGNYRIFVSDDATTSALLRAMDSAVGDGMDIINLSLGLEGSARLPADDPLFTAIENATRAGVLVVAAAGNQGPAARTIGSPATLPQTLAVGSASNARRFFATVRITALTPVPPALAEIPAFPSNQPAQNAPFGPAPLADVTVLDPSGLACPLSSSLPSGVNLPAGSLAGRIALIQRGQCLFKDKVRNVANAGALAAIIYNNVKGGLPILMDTSGNQIPSMSIGNEAGLALADFLHTAREAQAAFDPELVARSNPPDIVARSSSRGPTPDQAVKPDVVAPGEFIFSATQNLNPNGELYSPSRFTAGSGTSFAAPMVAGAAALVRQAHPSWRPAQIKSALVNTAVAVSATEDGSAVGAQIVGAGRLNALAAATATILAEPVSLSFGLRAPRSTSRETLPLKITNTATAADTFTLGVAPRSPVANTSVELDRTSVTLGPNQTTSTPVLVTFYNSGLVQTVVEGVISIRNQNTGQSINVPYWTSFLMPEVNRDGIVSAASFRSSGGVSPGSIISVFGVSLSALPSAVADSLPLPTELGGTKVTTGRLAAPLFYTSPGQVNAQVPFEMAPGSTSTLTVTVEGTTSTSVDLPLVQFSPGLFSVAQDGRGPGAILHANGQPVSAASPAAPGETVMLFGTGLGPVDNPPETGKPALANPLSRTTTTPQVWLNNLPAPVRFSGLAPDFVGLYQVNVEVPSGLAPGEYSVVLNIGGVSSNTVTIAVR